MVTDGAPCLGGQNSEVEKNRNRVKIMVTLVVLVLAIVPAIVEWFKGEKANRIKAGLSALCSGMS